MVRQSLHSPTALASTGIRPLLPQGQQGTSEGIFAGRTPVRLTPLFPSAPACLMPSAVWRIPLVTWLSCYHPPLLPLPWVRLVPDTGARPQPTAGTHQLRSSRAQPSTYLATLLLGLGALLPLYPASPVPTTYWVLGLPTYSPPDHQLRSWPLTRPITFLALLPSVKRLALGWPRTFRCCQGWRPYTVTLSKGWGMKC